MPVRQRLAGGDSGLRLLKNELAAIPIPNSMLIAGADQEALSICVQVLKRFFGQLECTCRCDASGQRRNKAAVLRTTIDSGLFPAFGAQPSAHPVLMASS